MMIQAEVSLYPLGEPALSPAIEALVRAIENSGCSVETGPMSSLVRGDTGDVFRALESGFEEAARGRRCVMVVKVSNACPHK
ncbi:MAG: thiamine-binding protein [Candidatus Brocadiae bacterium]|nr:thiamine-binding protein [Candidatus Brocadiia bacterium]